jgi:hypothetical protein
MSIELLKRAHDRGSSRLRARHARYAIQYRPKSVAGLENIPASGKRISDFISRTFGDQAFSTAGIFTARRSSYYRTPLSDLASLPPLSGRSFFESR